MGFRNLQENFKKGNGVEQKQEISLVKEIEIIHRLFLVIAMYCKLSQFKPVQWITKPTTLLAGWEGSLGTCSR